MNVIHSQSTTAEYTGRYTTVGRCRRYDNTDAGNIFRARRALYAVAFVQRWRRYTVTRRVCSVRYGGGGVVFGIAVHAPYRRRGCRRCAGRARNRRRRTTKTLLLVLLLLVPLPVLLVVVLLLLDDIH